MKITIKLELSETSIELRCKLANELKDPKALSILAEDANAMVRTEVAGNPNTFPSDLEQLARDESREVVWAAVKNPNIPTDDLLSFFYYARKTYYPDKYKDSKIKPNDLPVLSEYDAYRVLISLAQNTKAPKSLLAKLAKPGDFDYDIRLEVAENPNTSQSVLAEIAQDEDEFMRETVAKNPNLSRPALTNLIKDKVDDVREATTKNPNISKSDLLKLINDDDSDVRFAAKAELNIREAKAK